MLSRSAQNLFWLSRYMERAEATARLVGMGRRMAMLPGSNRDEWRSVARAGGAGAFCVGSAPMTEADVIDLLLLSEENPSSIKSSLIHARANAKAVRTALTQQMWETLNDGWRKLDAVSVKSAEHDLTTLLDWVVMTAATFRGAGEASMLRNDRFDFLRLGGFIERADMTLRLLDVKYYVLLPETDVVGGGRDYHHWTSILAAMSATRAFHHLYRGDFSPWKITDFIILNGAFPRSLTFCYQQIVEHLNSLQSQYGVEHPCASTAWNALVGMTKIGAGEIFRTGLHEFLTGAVATNNKVATEIAEAYHF